jgi:hypothetical protein
MTEKQVRITIRVSSALLAGAILLSIPVVPLSRALPQVAAPFTLIPIDEIITERQPPPPRRVQVGRISATSMPAPYFSPSPISAEPTQILIAEPSPEPPQVGLVSPVYEKPPEYQAQVRIEPLASPLPDILTQHGDEGPARPPAALPGPVPQRGEVYRGSGAADLEVSRTPAYTGPNLNLPPSDLPSTGLSHGEGVSGTPVPGVGPGDRYQSEVGSNVGSGPPSGLDVGGDIIGEGELSGLLAWLRQQKAHFPDVVRSYLETETGDLCGITSYAGWDIFIQFSEAEHQLKIFLAQSETGILLADSDFRQRSQLFGLGRVTRDANGTIVAIAAMREKPSRQRTDDFYRVFGNWMEARGIKMGSRAAR